MCFCTAVPYRYDIIEGTRHLVERRRLADRVITSALHRLLRRRLPEVHAICAANGLMVGGG